MDTAMWPTHNMKLTVRMWSIQAVHMWDKHFTIVSRLVRVKNSFSNILKLSAREKLFLLQLYAVRNILFTLINKKGRAWPCQHARWQFERVPMAVVFEVWKDNVASILVHISNEFTKGVSDRLRSEAEMNNVMWNHQRK